MASVHSVARKRAPTGPGAAMSSLPTAPSLSIERRADQPYARPWVGARLRATAAIHGVRRYRLSQSRSGRAGRVAPLWHKHNGLPHQTIAKLSDAATNTVTATIRTFVEKGLTGIEERKFHCPISQIDPHRSRLTAHFSVHPPRTLKEAVAEIERPTGLSFSLTHVRNILLGMGLSRKKQELFRESWTTRNGMNK
jgi:transposase